MNCRCCGRSPEQVTLSAMRSGLSGFVCRTRFRVIGEDENGQTVRDLICWFDFVWYCRAMRVAA